MRHAALLGLCAMLAGCGAEDAQPEPETFPEKDWPAEAEALLAGDDWYRHAVFYEVYVRSFQDSDGDGIGDLKGLTSRLDYLKELGVDAIWLMPIMPTPFKDSGYDISDYQGINPDYGSMAEFEALLAAAHERKLRVIMDLVLNHTSDQHAWFSESRKDKTNPKADWYVWSDTPSAPNNGCGTTNPTFGDSAWQLDPARGQYYFHRFYPEQPDLNYRSPAVVDATLDVARFWLDKGVDGFRCDVIGMLYESATECDLIPETRDYVKKLRKVVDEYPGRVMVAEPSKLTDASGYLGNGSDMFHMAFHFGYGYFWGFPFGSQNATGIVETFQKSLASYPSGAQDALVIGSHDVQRAFSVAQGDDTKHQRAALIQLTAQGTPFVYYGEELALRPGSQQIVDQRDKARTPMLWDASAGHGFTTGKPWLAFGAEAELFNVEAEQAAPDSMLSFYKALLTLRRGRAIWGTGQMEILDTGTTSVFALYRADDFMAYVAAVNMTEEAQVAELARPGLGSRAGRVSGSGQLTLTSAGGTLSLPANGAAIFRVR
ncbi:MAG: alpha-amylase [Polyangiaceae bacterium]|nr:alpha-amylase [Polyangiaceae bacterium]